MRTFSDKQLTALTWWCPSSPHRRRDAIICDGAVRSGKTVCMSLSFVLWASSSFSSMSFALCGKTIASLRRNVTGVLLPLLREAGFDCKEKLSRNYIDISRSGTANRFYLFGGRDEGSAALIQGMTLAGVMLDEVALMPRSFVEQAIARCSPEGARLWFNCNPENPAHWFYEEWIRRAAEKNCLYLHFTMRDNPSLSPATIARYKSLYSGAFYERFVEGKWVAAQGLVYPRFSREANVAPPPPGAAEEYALSCDYGTVNPSSFGLWGLHLGVWYREDEYYFDSRAEGLQRTDEEHYAALEELAGAREISRVIVDPSAASFIECIRRHGRFRVIAAKNDVSDGIRRTSDALREGRVKISPVCRDALREFGLYRWDSAASRDVPRKENDHAMDDIRYFVSTALYAGGDGFFAMSVER